MPTFLTKNISRKLLLAGAGLIAVAAVLVGFGLISNPAPAAAQESCRVIDSVPSRSVQLAEDTPSVGEGGAYGDDAVQDTHTINFSDYINSGEYVDEISYTLVSAGVMNGDCYGSGCSFTANTSGLTASENTSVAGSNGDSVNQSMSFTNDLSPSDSSASFDLDAYYEAQVAPNGGIEYQITSRVENIQLIACDDGADDDATLTVETDPSLSVDMTRESGPSDIGGETRYTRTYDSDITGEIRAGLVAGRDFDGWDGCDSTSGTNSIICEISVDTGEDKTITANYDAENTGPKTCSSVPVSGDSLTLSDSIYNPSYQYTNDESESETYVLDYDDYTNSNQFVKSIAYDLTASGGVSFCDGTCTFDTQTIALGASVSAQGGTYGGSSVSETRRFTRSQGKGTNSASFYLSPSFDFTIAQNGQGAIETTSGVSNIVLEVCHNNEPETNDPPVAVNDGNEPKPERLPAEFQTLKDFPALNNDYDPDGATGDPYQDLEIVSANTQRSDSTVSIVNNKLRYNPRDLNPEEEDKIYYTIEDEGGLQDSATVFIKISPENGTVSVRVGVDGNVAPEDLENLTFTPLYGGNALGVGNAAGGEQNYTVSLTTSGTKAEMLKGNIDLPTGYEFVEGENPEDYLWINKDSNEDLTLEENTEILGLPQLANNAPTSDFSYSFGSSGDLVNFTSQATDDDGSIASHSWDFGDGGTSGSSDPSHQYSGDGTYDVELTVTDNDGSTDTITRTVTISTVSSNSAPDADATYSQDSQTAGTAYYSFDASGSSDPDGDPLSYEWDYLGNDASWGSAIIDSPTSENTTVSIQNQRSDESVTFEFMLTATDPSGAYTSDYFNITVICQEPSGGAVQCLSESGGSGGPGSGGSEIEPIQ